MQHDTHALMLTWVSLVHAGTWLPAELSRYLQAELGISLSEQDLLRQIDVAGGQLRLVDLAGRIFLSKAGVTKMVDRLESAGQVVRKRSKDDRRAINACLTAEGKRTVDRSRPLLVAWVERNVGRHLTAGQLAGLSESLEAVLAGHDRWRGQLAHLRGDAS